MKTKYIKNLAGLLILLFSSCNFGAVFQPTTSAGFNNVTISVLTPGGRTLAPDLLGSVTEFEVTADNGTQTWTTYLRDFTPLAAGSSRTIKPQPPMISFSSLPDGDYTFQVKAFGASQGILPGALLAEGLSTSVNLNHLNPALTIPVNISPLSTGSGDLHFTLTVPSNLVDSYSLEMVDASEVSVWTIPVTPISSSVVFDKPALLPGSYWLTIRFYLNGVEHNNPWQESVLIIDGMTTPGHGKYGLFFYDEITFTEAEFTQLPDSPTNLLVSPMFNGVTTRLELNWQDYSNFETGYNIYRDGVLIASLSANTNYYLDATADSNLAYTYDIKAVNFLGESYPSSITTSSYGGGPILRVEAGGLFANPSGNIDVEALYTLDLVSEQVYSFDLVFKNVGISNLILDSINETTIFKVNFPGATLSPGTSINVPVVLDLQGQPAGYLAPSVTFTGNMDPRNITLEGESRNGITYHVYGGGFGGNDNNTGESTSPYETIGKALSVAQSGDSIKVAAVGINSNTQGFYAENLTITKSVSISGNWSPDFLSFNQLSWETTLNPSTGTALTITGLDITPIISNFQFAGQTTAQVPTIVVSGGAKPVFDNLEVVTSGTLAGVYQGIKVQGNSVLTMNNSVLKLSTVPGFSMTNGLYLDGSTYTGAGNTWDGSAITTGGQAVLVDVAGGANLTSSADTYLLSGNPGVNFALRSSGAGVKNISVTAGLFSLGTSLTPVGGSRALDILGDPGTQLTFTGNHIQSHDAVNSVNLIVVGSDVGGLLANNLIQTRVSLGGNKRGIMTYGAGGLTGVLRIYHNTFLLQGGWNFVEVQTPNLDIQNNIFLGGPSLGGTAVYQNGAYKPAYFRGNDIYQVDQVFNGINLSLPGVNDKTITGDGVLGGTTRGNTNVNPDLNITPVTAGKADAPLSFNTTPSAQIRLGGADVSALVTTDYNLDPRTGAEGYSIGAFEANLIFPENAWPYEPWGQWHFAGMSLSSNGVITTPWTLTPSGSLTPSFTDRAGNEYEADLDGISSYTAGPAPTAGYGELTQGFTVSTFVSMSDVATDITGTIFGANETISRFWELNADYDTPTEALNFSFRYNDDTRSIPDSVQQFGPFKPHVPFGLRKYIFVAVVVNNAAGTLELYVNNEKLGTLGNPGIPFNPEVATLTLGSGFQGGFKGQIDTLRIHNRPLSSVEVAALATDGGSLDLSIGVQSNFNGFVLTPASPPVGLAAPIASYDRFDVDGDARFFNGGWDDNFTAVTPSAAELPGTVLPDILADGFADSFSLGFWFKPLGVLDNEQILHWGATTNGLILKYTTANQGLTPYNGVTPLNGTVGVSRDQWHHVFFSVDYVAQDFKMWVDGKAVTPSTGVQVTRSPTDLLRFGGSTVPGRFALDDVKFYPRALSSLEREIIRFPVKDGTNQIYHYPLTAINNIPDLNMGYAFNNVLSSNPVGDTAVYNGGAPTFGADRYNRGSSAVTFTATSYVSVNIANGAQGRLINNSQARNIAFWLKTDTFVGTNFEVPLVHYSVGADGWGVYYKDVAGSRSLVLKVNGTQVDEIANVHTTWPVGDWKHFLVTLGAPNGASTPYDLRISSDITSPSLGPVTLPPIDGTQLNIGGVSGKAAGWTGSFDDFKVFTRELTEVELKDLRMSAASAAAL